MRFHTIIAIAALSLPSVARADTPTTRPAEIPALILQLGDNSFKIRAVAAQRLGEIGEAALPTLREAVTHADVEVRIRAVELIGEITGISIPIEVPRPLIAGNGGFYPTSRHTRQSEGACIIDASEAGRSFHIERYPTGVVMTISGQISGKPVVCEYRFRDPADLRKTNAQAYELYELYMPDEKLPDNVTVRIQVSAPVRR